MGAKKDETIKAIIHIMKETYGKDLTIFDDAFLTKSLERRISATAIKAADYLLILQDNNHEADLLMASFNITYSQFFRNSMTFAVLEQLVLPQLLSRKPEGGEIRVWSAGCSTGQEAYSIGILLDEMIKSASKSMRYRIFATDLSREALDVARTGSYDQDGVGNLRMKHLKNYFTRKGETYTVDPQLKQTIDFTEYDLLDPYSINPPDSIFGDFDIIFCCNLLFYYRNDVRRAIIKKLKRSLSAQGYLVTGEAEAIFMGKDEELKMISTNAAIFQMSK